MKHVFLKRFFIAALGLFLLMLYVPRLSADEDTTQAGDVIDMVSGDIQTVPVSGLTRVSVTNPEVADISDAQSDKVSLLAKKAGETVLYLWDANGKRSVKVRVSNEDLSTVKDRVQKLLDEANITGVSLDENLDEGKVVMTGSLSKDDKSRLGNILGPYSDNLLNLVKEEKNEQLIQVDMQVVEISTSLEKNLGILWGTSTTSNIINAEGNIAGTTSSSSGSVNLNYNENQPASKGSIGDLFKIGKFFRTSSLEATVNALIQEGKAKLISKPRLVVVSGKQASFLVGGEIPILTTTTNTTGSTLTQNTTYTQYGVNMTVTPTIREGKIDVMLNVDIRDIDSSNSSNGNVAFITRTASTDLFMDNKQTIVLAGLIKYSDSEQMSGIPFLSKIPILGLLFRNSSTPSPDTNTEMVIILTPTVMTEKKITDSQLVMPTAAERGAYQGFDSKYEHEPLVSDWPAAKTETSSVTPPSVTPYSETPSETSSVTPPMPDVNTPAPMGLDPITAYARMVQEKISKAISYPQAARSAALAGTVKLKLRILKNGSLDWAQVTESSGSSILDQVAMQAARTAAPYDAFTTGINQEGLIFTVPIVYNKLMTAPADKVVASY